MGLSRNNIREIITGEYTDDEKIDKLISGHSQTVDYYKEELGKYTDYEELKNKVTQYEATPKTDWESKYNELENNFNQYKSGIEARDARLEKTNSYRNKLIEAGIDAKRLDTIVRVTNMDELDLDSVTTESIANEWGDFIVATTTTTVGAGTQTPPPEDSNAVSREKFRKMSYSERADLYVNNRDLYNSLTS